MSMNTEIHRTDRELPHLCMVYMFHKQVIFSATDSKAKKVSVFDFIWAIPV